MLLTFIFLFGFHLFFVISGKYCILYRLLLYTRNGGNNENKIVASYGIGAKHVDLFYNVLETLRDNN